MNSLICEGEILKVEKRAKFGERHIVRYTVLAFIKGKRIVMSNVEATNMFGGIADYTVVRQRAMFDTAETSDFPIEQNEIDATIGARVVLAVLSPNCAYIIGYKQHPNQVPEMTSKDQSEASPSAVFQFLGVRVEIKETGDVQFIHKGLPSIAFKPETSSQLDNNLVGAQLETEAKTGGDITGGNGNAAIKPAPTSEIVLWEMTAGGGFAVRDSIGQTFKVDQATKKTTWTNNYLPSWLSSEAPDASKYTGIENEYIEMDKAAGSITFKTSKLTSILSDGDRDEQTKGKHTAQISKTYSMHIKDNEDRKVDGGYSFAVEKGSKSTVGADFSLAAKGSISLEASGGSKLKMANGKISFGGGGAELLDLFDQTLKALDTILINIEAITTLGNLGLPTSPPINVAAFVSDQAVIAQIKAKLGSIKG